MTDDQFERRARAWLELGPSQAPIQAVEAVLAAVATMPQARPIDRRPARRMIYLAAAAALAAALGAAFMIGTQQPRPPTPTPTPMPSAPVSLPDIAALTANHPPATIRIERSVGPADAPVSSSTSTSRIDFGPVRLVHGYFVNIACLGPGHLIVSVVEGGRTSFPDSPLPCDGSRFDFDFPSLLVANETGTEVSVIVTVADGASWRLVLGEYLAEAEAAPDFPTPAITEGWNYMQDVPPVRAEPPTVTGPGPGGSPGGAGARLQIPQHATRVGIFLQCQGESSVSITADDSVPATVDCRGGATQRVEFPVTGGQELSVRAVSDGVAWIRLYVEANGEIATTYLPAPPLPEGLAKTPYAAEAQDFLAFGTLGSNHQTLIPVRWARPGLGGGDFVAASIPNETTGAWRLDLFSLSEARVVRTLAEVQGPAQLGKSLVDSTHGQVFYLVARADGTGEYRRVALNGTDDRLIVTLPADGISLADNLSRDQSIFVIEFCRDTTTCFRYLVDTATLEVRTIDVAALPLCRIDAVVGDLVIETSGGPCAGAETPFVTWATSLEDGDRRLLAEGAVERYVVETTTGPKLVYTTGWSSDAGKTFHRLDIASGDTDVLISFDADSPESDLRIGPARLPAGWVLLAGMLNEYPAGRLGLGEPPFVINVETGAQIELVNLPHRRP